MKIIIFYGVLALWVAYVTYCIWTCEREKSKGKCKYFKLIKTIEKGELDKYYCGHPNNEESECENCICPLERRRGK